MREPVSVWEKIAAPLPPDVIQWRQDGKPIARGGKFFARFVAYVDAQFVRERLDSVAPGNWQLSIKPLPAIEDADAENRVSFKARLTIQGVAREDVGSGRDYKNASSDAFKRAAVRFGIAHELYAYDQNWVEVDGDGKYAKALQDPAEVYARHGNRAAPPRATAKPRAPEETPASRKGDGDFFGKPRGTPLGEYDNDALKKIIAWLVASDEKNPSDKLKEKLRTARAILADRSLGLDDDSVVKRMVEAEDKAQSGLPF